MKTQYERIRFIFDDCGKKPADIARLLGETPQTVNGWKSTGKIRKENLYKLCDELGYSYAWVMDGGSEEEAHAVNEEYKQYIVERRPNVKRVIRQLTQQSKAKDIKDNELKILSAAIDAIYE